MYIIFPNQVIDSDVLFLALALVELLPLALKPLLSLALVVHEHQHLIVASEISM